MHPIRITLAASLLLILPSLSGCARPAATPAPAETGTDAASAPPADAAAATTSREDAKACDLVTSAEMSVILGSTVIGTEPNHKSSGKTECIYKPVDAPSPYVEFSVEWGEGQSAMAAMGMMNKMEPGISNPYAGIGDQAAAVGTALMIRSGEDLITITFSGVDDAPAKARKIFDTAKVKM